MSNPQGRFSSRVANYIRYRPHYPQEVLTILEQECGLSPQSVIADIGSGTGILAVPFLKNGNKVFGVEPNDDMRSAAESLLSHYKQFVSVGAAAERTNLTSASVDFVIAGQAFHWFDAELARHEFRRILKNDGWVVLIWNERKLDSTPFLRRYESLLLKWGTDYEKVRHENTTRDLEGFFAPEVLHVRRTDNLQEFDLAGLEGRLYSSSYTPEPGSPNFAGMVSELRALFAEHAQSGKVAFEYETAIYFGHLPHKLQ